MGICDHCGTDTTNTYHDNIDSALHRSCDSEFNRRIGAKLCVFCNEVLGPGEIDLNDIKHERCRKIGKCVGYPYQ